MDVDILNDKAQLENETSNCVSEEDFFKFFLNLRDGEIFNISDLTPKQKDIYLRENGFISFFHFDLIDKKQRRFNDLSHGEQQLFGQLFNVYYHSSVGNQKDLMLLFDEPDISLHPNWQRKYIYELVSLIEKLNKNFHFVITSHSPFILSDIPNQDIVFLKGGKQVDAFDKKHTLGANIHTLLSDGFFMKDGLMGEFGKNKIEEVIRFLDDKKSDIESAEDAQKIINIIGEPLLKKELQRMLDSKRLEKINKVGMLENEIAMLKNRVSKLENRND